MMFRQKAKKAFLAVLAAVVAMSVTLGGCKKPLKNEDESSATTSTTTKATTPQGKFETNLTGWKGQSGTWLVTTEGYRVISAGQKNNFAMSDVTVSGKDFTFEGLVIVPDEPSDKGCTVSLVYGATNPDDVAAGTYYTATLDLTNKFMRMFSFSKGEMIRLGAIYPLKNEEIAAGTFHLKVDVDTKGYMNFYLNNEIVTSAVVPDFKGGGLGLATYNANALFNAVKLSDGAAGNVNNVKPEQPSGGGESNFKTNLTGWTGKVGTWLKTEKGYEITSAGRKNNYALSDVKRTDNFTYEAQITIPDTRPDDVYGISLIFGANIGNNLGEGTYCEAKIDIYNKFSRFFSFNDGTMGRHGKMYQLSTKQLTQNVFNLRIDVKTSGDVVMYIDGQEVCATNIPNYKGGLLGLATYNIDAIFNNVNVSKLKSAPAPTEPPKPNFVTNLTGWTSKEGTWLKTEKGYEVTSAGRRNNYAMSDVKIEAGKAFTYEADITLPDTRPDDVYGVSLIFGVNVGEKLIEGHYYEAKIDIYNKIARIFGIVDGKIDERLGKVHNLTEAEQTAKSFHIKLMVFADGKMEMYIGDQMINTATTDKYTGGFLGLCTYNTDAVFNNVKLTMN